MVPFQAIKRYNLIVAKFIKIPIRRLPISVQADAVFDSAGFNFPQRRDY